MEEDIPELRVIKTNRKFKYKRKISSSRGVVDLLKQIIGDYCNYKEVFVLLTLSRKNEVTGFSIISIGTSIGTMVDIPDICRIALLSASNNIIVAHNHPSGEVKPSKEDLKVSRKIKSALEPFDINLLDSIIVRDEDSEYYSLADNMDL